MKKILLLLTVILAVGVVFSCDKPDNNRPVPPIVNPDPEPNPEPEPEPEPNPDPEPDPQPGHGYPIDPEAVKGSEKNPFNIAEAIAEARKTGDTPTEDIYYVIGIAESGSIDTYYGNATYKMVDKRGDDAYFTAYRIKDIEGEAFTDADKIKEGHTIVIRGNIVNYKNNTPEINGANAQLVYVSESVTAKPEDPNPDPVGLGAWMEVSSTDYYGTELNTVTHYYKDTATGKKLRNYTLGYYNDKKIAIWVAYHLVPEIHCGGSRTETWAWDPKIESKYQVDLTSAYGQKDEEGLSYDRGHQLPSADRAANEEANNQTFYFTNMTCQRGKKFNQSIWADFEKKVRNWAYNCDTLYVVTGCDIKGSTEYTDKGHQPIPVGYYKAIMRYSRTGAPETMGFYLEHKNYNSNPGWKSFAMSIDDLEEKIGIDFFVNLPVKFGEQKAAQIEAVTPDKASSFWF